MTVHLVQGHRAAGRYRLESRLGGVSANAMAWRAMDETLERHVAVRFYDASLDGTRLIERAAVAASLTHPHIVRVFDTGFDGGMFFAVTELAPGSLAWARLPLPGADAARLGAEVADALHYAHQRGVAHGALHTGNVLLSEQGAKLDDFALSEAAASGSTAEPADDLVQLGRLLRTVVTGDPAAHRPAPDDPPGLTRVVDALVGGRYSDARSAALELEDLLDSPAPPPSRRRFVLPAAAAAGIFAVAVAGVVTLGTRNGRPGGASGDAGRAVAIAAVHDFDPEGDGAENPRLVQRAADGDQSTFWRTERYSGGFPDGKGGVGVIADLGRVRDVTRARVTFVAPGCTYELRHADDRPRAVEAWTLAAGPRTADRSDEVALDGARGRYWLVWITGLTAGVPGAGGRLSCGVAELSLSGS